jgi:hypothetical protein
VLLDGPTYSVVVLVEVDVLVGACVVDVLVEVLVDGPTYTVVVLLEVEVLEVEVEDVDVEVELEVLVLDVEVEEVVVVDVGVYPTAPIVNTQLSLTAVPISAHGPIY